MWKKYNKKKRDEDCPEHQQVETMQEALESLADLVGQQRQEEDSLTDTLGWIADGRIAIEDVTLDQADARVMEAVALVANARKQMRLMFWRRTASVVAVLLFVLLVGSLLFENREAKAAVTLADVQQALAAAAYMRTDLYRDGAFIASSWSGGQGVYGHKNEKGGVIFVTAHPQQKWEYDPKTHIITVSWPGDGYRGCKRTPLESAAWIFDRYSEYAQLIESVPGKLDGRNVEILEIEGTQQDPLERVVIWCDPQRALPLKLQRAATEFLFSYPETGPQSIYDLGVSHDGRVVSTIPSDEVKQVIQAFYQWRQAIYEEALKDSRIDYYTPKHMGRIIENDYSRAHGLIGIEQEIQGKNRYHSPSGSYHLTLPSRRVFYFDPEKDYMWVRYDEFIEPDPPWQVDTNWRDGREVVPLQKHHTIYEVTEFGQTNEGIWYPKTVAKREVE